MKVAYVSIWDATDVRNWSGLDLNIWKAVVAAGAEVELVGNLHIPRSFPRRLRKWWAQVVEHKQVSHFWDIGTAKGLARSAEQRLATVSADVILSPSPLPLAFLRDRRPKVFWTDATFAGLSASYPEFSPQRLSAAAVRGGRAIDRAVARNAAASVYASDWAARTAVSDCGADARRVRTIPFGANVERAAAADARSAGAAIEQRDLSRPQLLLVGVDWDRKGGSKAVAVVRGLRARGIEATLTVVGCRPPGQAAGRTDPDGPTYIRYLDFVDKTTPAGREQLAALYRSSAFLIVPSMAEAYGLVFAEAAAFAVPSVSHRVGGIPTVVRDGQTGRLFGLEDPVDAWVDWLFTALQDRVRYAALATSAWEDFNTRLNWGVAGRAMDGILNSVVARSASGSLLHEPDGGSRR